MMQKKNLLLFLISLTAIAEPPVFHRIGIEHGLSQSSSMVIVQDREGFLWVGTWDGLNRYDGYNFIHYKHDPNDSTSISNNSIRSLCVDRNGDLWIGTASSYLNQFHKRKRNFSRHIFPEMKSKLQFSSILRISQDSSGRIWTLNSNVLEMVDPTTSDMTRMLLDTIPITRYSKEQTVGGLVFIHSNRLVTITSDGSVLAQEIRYHASDSRMLSYENTYYQDKQGRAWVYSSNSGIYEYDWNDGSLIPRFKHTNDPKSLTSNEIRSMYEDSRGNLWVGTSAGLNRSIRNAYGTIVGFERFVHEPNNPNSLSTNEVYTIYEDRSGVIWIGTQIGLNKIIPQRKYFSPIPKRQAFGSFYQGNFPITFYEESDSLLWIGTKQNLYFCNPFTEHRQTFNANNSGLSHSTINILHRDKNGVMWVGTPEGLNKYDTITKNFIPVLFQDSLSRRNGVNKIYAIAEDKDGMLWIGTIKGIVRYNSATGISDRIFFDTVNAGEGNSFILSLFIHEDSVWVGTNNQGLLIVDRQTLNYRRYTFDRTNPASLSNNKPMCIYRDRHGSMWVATLGGGLNKVIRRHDDIWFQRFQRREGLLNDYVYGILEDDEGNLWLSTNNGLSKFYVRQEKFSNFTQYDGLFIQEFNQNAYHRGKSGYMYFGGIEGSVRFRPDEIGYNSIPPQIAITKFEIFNEDENDKLYDDEIILSHTLNFFSFEFASLCFEVPEKNQYAYKLEGLESDWNYIGTRRFASFTNIDPGEYIFRVKGTNNDGVWTEEEKSVKIIIVPPFWATTWFRTLTLFVALGSIVGGVRFAAYRKYRRQIDALEHQKIILEERQRTRDKIARDLHDDLASTVGSAGLFIETAKRTLFSDSTQAKEYLDKTSSILNEAEEAMSDIVWSVSPKHDTLHSLLSRIKLVTADLARANGIGYTIDVKGEIEVPLPEEVRRGFYLIFKEGLNNCLKHSRATMITVCIEYEQQRLRFRLKDNGIGFSMETTSEKLGGNGMSNMRKRANEIGSDFSITSGVGIGTEIIVEKQLTQLSH